ncbi:MAG: TetR/AcrR family transcriptional regulator [Deltaproteobacteria bacterium]|jgi:TetR/AcrR family transcriptional repressor of nem operon|nr:TetR/AcrR family transcriptional regulator [Deltaproteobacteria bacterium]MBW2468896.1 TetR/AcrR family transcriptional regulator [Deltaproteobacteria bacterium]MBW2516350.1 TetR/AcrR family transcriptional regulator [Deltaproteobacteria bacterium]
MLSNTRDRIIETGAAIIHRKGFNHTGIQEILTAAGVPKGSFYHYFKSKNDLGLAIVDYFSDHFRKIAGKTLDDTAISPLNRIYQCLTAFMDHFESQNYAGGCPIGNLAQEMGGLDPEFRAKLKESIDMMIDAYSQVLAAAQQDGKISKSLDIKDTASFIVAGWHGAIIQMKLAKSLTPLKNHRNFIFDHILRK